eukprot:g2530.t1
MLHDWARNNAYQQAITAALENPVSPSISLHRPSMAKGLHSVPVDASMPATIYDVGAGVGLLAVMAAKAGADHVVAVEHSEAIAALLATVVENNNVTSQVSVVIGDAFDLPSGGYFKKAPPYTSRPPVVIVHELFANNMLCEFCHGVIPFVRENVGATRVIPARARTYAVLVDSRYLSGFGNPATNDHRANNAHDVSGVDISSVHAEMFSNSDFADAIGTLSLPQDDLIRVSEPVLINGLDFETGEQYEVIQWAESDGDVFKVTREGTARAVVVYWEADMLSEPGSPILSIDPTLRHAPPSRARMKSWPNVVQSVLKSAPANKDRGEWDGRVNVGDTVGFSWRHHKRNKKQPGDGCVTVVTLKSHNGRDFASTNRFTTGFYFEESDSTEL